jgi:hypothetical protein
MGIEANVKIRFEGWQLKIEKRTLKFLEGRKCLILKMIHDTRGVLLNLYTDV